MPHKTIPHKCRLPTPNVSEQVDGSDQVPCTKETSKTDGVINREGEQRLGRARSFVGPSTALEAFIGCWPQGPKKALLIEYYHSLRDVPRDIYSC